MTDVRSQIVTDFNTLVEVSSQISAKLTSPNLTDNERQLYLLKLSVIKMITGFLKALMDQSPKLKALVMICLTDGRCSSEEAEKLGFRSIGHMRFVRDQLRTLLASSVLETGIINLLFRTDSIAEVQGIINWYKANVIENVQLRRFIARN